ncbi:hypothetical protein M1555_01995 [Patescibacteria group bacterium]|nr:hypothetical protein [Patescibacteria group bacterium]
MIHPELKFTHEDEGETVEIPAILPPDFSTVSCHTGVIACAIDTLTQTDPLITAENIKDFGFRTNLNSIPPLLIAVEKQFGIRVAFRHGLVVPYEAELGRTLIEAIHHRELVYLPVDADTWLERIYCTQYDNPVGHSVLVSGYSYDDKNPNMEIIVQDPYEGEVSVSLPNLFEASRDYLVREYRFASILRRIASIPVGFFSLPEG